LVRYTDANTSATTYVYNTANQLTRSVDPDLRTRRYEYTPGRRLAAVADGAGGRTSYTYDVAGRLKTKTTPRGNVAGANPADFTTTYSYDANGNITSMAHPYPGGGVQAMVTTYDSVNEPVAITDPLGRTTKASYDETGNRVSATDPLGNVRTFTYDGTGRVLTSTDPRGGTTTNA